LAVDNATMRSAPIFSSKCCCRRAGYLVRAGELGNPALDGVINLNAKCEGAEVFAPLSGKPNCNYYGGQNFEALSGKVFSAANAELRGLQEEMRGKVMAASSALFQSMDAAVKSMSETLSAEKQRVQDELEAVQRKYGLSKSKDYVPFTLDPAIAALDVIKKAIPKFSAKGVETMTQFKDFKGTFDLKSKGAKWKCCGAGGLSKQGKKNCGKSRIMCAARTPVEAPMEECA